MNSISRGSRSQLKRESIIIRWDQGPILKRPGWVKGKGDSFKKVGGCQEGATGAGEVGEDGADDLKGLAVDGIEGLVEKVEVGIVEEGPGEEDPLLLPAGEGVDLAVGEMGDPEFLQELVGAVPLGPTGSAEPASADVGAGHDHGANGDGEIPLDFATLGEVAGMRVAVVGGAVEDAEAAGLGSEETGSGLEEGGLPGPVGSDEDAALAAPQLKADGFEGVYRSRAVADTNRIGHEDWRGGFRVLM